MPTAAVMFGTSLTTATAHPFCLFVDGLDIIKQPSTTGGTGFGTLVDSVVLHEKSGTPSTLTFNVDDPSYALSSNFRRGAYVYFVDHTGRPTSSSNYATDDLFRGFLESAALNADATNRQWACSAIGIETLLDRTVIPSGVLPFNMDFSAAIQAVMAAYSKGDYISWLFKDTTAIDTGNAWMSTGGNTLLADVPLTGKTIRQALEDIGRAASQYALYSSPTYGMNVMVEPQGRLRAAGHTTRSPGGNTPREGNRTPTTIGAANVAVDYDMSQLINAVYVRGVDAVSSGWVVDQGSISSNGRFEAFLDAPTAFTSTQRDVIGTRYLQDRLPTFTIHMTGSGSHALTYNSSVFNKGFHVDMADQLITANQVWPVDSGVFPNFSGTYTLYEMTQTWKGGGNYTSIDYVWGGFSKNVGALLYQRDNEALTTSKAGSRLAGTLGEVAVRVKAGQPVDSDFDSARDGFIVVDTTNSVLWIRVNGAWQISNVIIPGSNALILGGDVELRRSATKTLTIDTDGAGGALTAVQLAGATPLEFSTDAFIRRSAAKTLMLDTDGAGTTLTAVDFVGAFERGFSGTSFPASPATNDRFYRTDLTAWFVWNGTRWLSTTLYRETFLINTAVQPYAAGAPNIGFSPAWLTDFDQWIEKLYASTFVATTNNGTNFWTVNLFKVNSAFASTSIGSFTTAADTAGVLTKHSATVNALLTPATNPIVAIGAAITLAPGAITLAGAYTYRLVGV